MGIAWFDDEAPDELEQELRTGGRPLLPPGAEWPRCPRCELPMLFRAQLPLAMTSLVPYDDERLTLLFECHARVDGSPCIGALALNVEGELEPATPPPPSSFNVWLTNQGAKLSDLARVLGALDAETPERQSPSVVLEGVPSSIAYAAVDAIREAGGVAQLRTAAPTTLVESFGGRMVPFEDGAPGARRTTLPPLRELMNELGRVPIRGIFGGATPGYRDHAFQCSCGKPTRTAVRLLATEEQGGISLGPATVQHCVSCGKTTLLRLSGPRRSAPQPTLSLVSSSQS